MKVEVLLATMHRENYDILKELNIKTDITVINQTNQDSFEKFELFGKRVLWINSKSRGLSKSRNDAIYNAEKDICLLADDDMIYRDGYEDVVLDAFKNNPNADIIVFGIKSIESKQLVGLKTIKTERINYHKIMKACSVQLGLKVNSIKNHNLRYNEQVGPGGRYNMGDENIFLTGCCKKGLIFYSCPSVIADLHTEDSSWFKGYTEKYLFDRGAILGGMSRYLSYLFIIRFALKNYKQYSSNYTMLNAIRIMLKGRKDFVKYVGYEQ
ncbi:MAG: glycosyltransferase family A protein [Lachnospiraceae bacterium]|nr:glycosyltransferase family A protein [Lachnospiraceae bacterium]